MKLTRAFLVILTAIITVFDVATLALRGYDTTISWQLYTLAKDWPAIPFALGFLAGHVFMPNRAAKQEPPT